MNTSTDEGVFGTYIDESCGDLIVILSCIRLEDLKETKRIVAGVLVEIRSRHLTNTSLDRHMYDNLLSQIFE